MNVINRNPGHGHRTSSRHKNHHDRRNSSMNSGSVGVPRWSTSFVDHSFLLDDRGGAGGSYHLPMASASTFSESPEQSQHHRRRPPTSGAAAGVPPSAAPPLPHPAAAVHQTASQALGRSSDERQAGMMAFEDPSDPVTQTDDGGSTTSPAPDWVGVHPAGFTSPSTAMCTTASQSSCPSPCHPIPGGTESFHTAHPVLQPVAMSHSHPQPHHNGYSAGRRMDQGNDFHSSNNANYSHPSSSNHHHNGNTSNNNNNNNGFTMSYFEQNFEPLRLLGRGAYGAAILSRHRMSGKYYAVKVLLVHDYDSERDVLQEVRVHAALSCKYLVQYHNSWSEIITPQRAMELSSIGVVPKQQKGKALWKAYQEARRHRPAHDHHHHDGVQQHPSQEAVHESSLVVHQPSSFRGSSPSRYSAGSLTPSSVTPGTTFRGYTSPVAPYHSLPFSGGSSGYGSPLPVFPAGAMAATGGRAVLSPPSLRASGGLLPQLVNPVSSSSLSPVRPLHEDFAAAALPHTWSYILDDDDDGVGGYLQGTDDDEEEEETSSLSSNSSSRSTNTSSVTTWGRTPRESSSSSSSSRPPQASTLPSQSLVLMNMRAVFIQMQLCQLTLAEHLGNRKAIDRIENLVIMLQLCTGLLYIHDRGILHRDVKPTNIFLDYSGRFTAASTTLSEDDDEEEEQLDWATGRFRTSVTAAEDVDDEDGLPLAGVGKSGSYHVVPHRHSKQLDSPLRLYTAAFCGTGRFPAFTLAASQRHHQHQRQRRRAGRRGSNEADAAVGDDPLDLDDLLGTINDNDEDEEDYSYVMGAAERGGLGGLASFCGGENSEVVDGRFCSSLARLPSFASPNASSIFSPSIQSPRQFVMPQLPNPWVTGAGGSLSDSFAPRAAPSEATREEIRELLRTMRAGPGEDTATFIQNHREELLRRWRHRLNSSGVSQVHQGSRLLARWLMRHLVHAMLGDFGLAKLHVQQRPQFLNGGMIFSMKDANTKGVGSPLYASPEQLRGDICTCSSDAFSLALVMAEMYLLPTTAAERLDVLQKTRNRRYPTSDVIQKYPELSVIPLLTRENPMTRVPLRDLRKYLFGMLQKCLNDELNSYVRGAQ